MVKEIMRPVDLPKPMVAGIQGRMDIMIELNKQKKRGIGTRSLVHR